MIQREPSPQWLAASRHETSCRSCGHTTLEPILSLGETPLANSLLTAAQLSASEPRFPLDLAYCPACGLVQITETVSPELLYRDYLYASSFSDAFLSHARRLAERLVSERRLGADSLVVELASNDGYLLRNYVQRGVPVLGIEPARNLARLARERGVATRDEFFSSDLADELAAAGARASVIHANNVLAHVPDLNGVVRGMRTLLAPRGVVVIEVPYLVDMVDGCEFDTIYHEHLCYFSLAALDALFRRHALELVNVERLPVHGGSVRLFAMRAEDAGFALPRTRDEVRRQLDDERRWEGTDGARYRAFGTRVRELLDALRDELERMAADGRTLAAYGASAKGSTLLNSLRLPAGLLQYVVDRSTLKQGRYTPGTHLPIVGPERLAAEGPDGLLLLTWNFADEILAQQAEYRRRGGRFLIPIPTPRWV